MKKDKELTAEEKKKLGKLMGSLGGKATLKKYGKKHFSKLANKRWWAEEMKKKK